MKMKTLLLTLCLFNTVIQAQNAELSSSEKSSDENKVSIALNTEGETVSKEVVPLDKGNIALVTSIPEKNESGFQIITVQKKENLNFALSAYLMKEMECVVLSIDQFDGLSYTLTDLDGRIMEANPIVSVETPVEFFYLIPSDYYIEVNSYEGLIQKFKIIKEL